MTEQEFRLKADEALERAQRALLPLADTEGFEVELQNGVLQVVFEDPVPAKFVVSPNTPVRQIWVSALTKSFKLDWNEGRQTFVLPDTGQSLRELLADAVSKQLGTTVSL
jgi:iron donor protein CyaY